MTSANGKPKTILVAEDDPGVREICERVLVRSGYRVLLASNGRETISLLEESRGAGIDLLLVDVVMPLGGGREVADYLAEHRLEIPVLFTSGFSDHPDSLAAGMSRFLQKPYTLAELLAAVKTALSVS